MLFRILMPAIIVLLAVLAIPELAAARSRLSVELLQRNIVVEKSREDSPALGKEAMVGQGATMYAEVETAFNRGIKLLAHVYIRQRKVFHLGKILPRYRLSDGEVFCGADLRNQITCLYGRRGVSGQVFYAHTQWGMAKDLKRPARYVDAPIVISAEAVGRAGANKFHAEILYQGAAASVLRLLYREYSNDTARPAFTQELTYDVGDQALTVSVRGARVEVLEAGNAGIKYRVLSGFER